MNEQRKTYADLKDELLITRDQIAKRVKEMGADILYEIAFDKVGTKKLMATYAKLKKAAN